MCRAGLPGNGNLDIAVYDLDGIITGFPTGGAIGGVGTFGSNESRRNRQRRTGSHSGRRWTDLLPARPRRSDRGAAHQCQWRDGQRQPGGQRL